MTLAPYRKINLVRLASSVVITVLETLLDHKQEFYKVSFCMKDLTTEESAYVERLITEFLKEYEKVVCMTVGTGTISVSLTRFQDSSQEPLPVPCTEE